MLLCAALTCGMLFCATLLYPLKLTWHLKNRAWKTSFVLGLASWQVRCQFRECKSSLCSLWMVESWCCRMCLCQGYVSQQKVLESTRMGGLGSRVNRKGMLEHVSWSSICHATICPSAKDCWIDVAKMTVNQSYESSNLNQWRTWNRTLYRCSCLRPLIWKQHEKPSPLEISKSDSLWWMFMDVYSKLRFFFWLMLVKRTWPKGRRSRSQAVILQRPTCRLEGLRQLHVISLNSLDFLGKGCYCYGILSQEVQRPNLGTNTLEYC